MITCVLNLVGSPRDFLFLQSVHELVHHHHHALMFQNLMPFGWTSRQCGRHLKISVFMAFREFTEIPTEHSAAKRAERTACFPETHSSVQAYSLYTQRGEM